MEMQAAPGLILQTIPTMIPIRVGADGTLYGLQPLSAFTLQQGAQVTPLPTCIVDHCPYNSKGKALSPGVILHGFPKTLARIKQWLLRTGQYFGDLKVLARDIQKGKQSFHLCSCHFTPDSYTTMGTKRILRADAIPTLFPRKNVLASTFLPQPTSLHAGIASKDPAEVTVKIENDACFTPHAETACSQTPYVNPVMMWKMDKGVLCPESSFQGKLWNIAHDHNYQKTDPSSPVIEVNGSSSAAEELDTSGGKVECSEEASSVSQRISGSPPGNAANDQKDDGLGSGDSLCPEGFALKNYAVISALEKVLVSLMQLLCQIPLDAEEKPHPVATETILKTEEMLNQALDVISLLTGVRWHIVKTDVSRPPEKVPVQFGDFSVYFSNKEWEYIEKHKDLYKEVITEDPLSDSVWRFKEKWKTGVTQAESHPRAHKYRKREASPFSDYDVGIASPAPEYNEGEASPNYECGENSEDGEENIKSSSGSSLHPEGSEPPRKRKSFRPYIPSDWKDKDWSDENWSDSDSRDSDFSEKLRPSSSPKRKENHGNLKNETRSTRQGLKRAAASKPREENHWCEVCEVCFPDKYELVLHQTTHIGELALQCTKCGKDFPDQAQLLQHHETEHSEEDAYTCQCGKIFFSKYQLSQHKELMGKRHFRCNDCGKYFDYHSQLIIHQRAHTGERPYECKECGAAFGHKSSLVVHQRIHTGQNPFKCNICNKGFHRKRRLKQHVAVHNSIKPPKPPPKEARRQRQFCPECGKLFVYKSNFTKHLKRHKKTSKTRSQTT